MRERFETEIELNSLSLLHADRREVRLVLSNLDICEGNAKEAIITPKHDFPRLEINQ